MARSPAHTKWLVDTGERLKTADGKVIEIWEFRHEKDEAALSEWAKHFRNHYCLDAEIDFLRGNRSRADYLTNIKFPSRTPGLGPAIRAGDFAEILVCDYLEWLLDYWVPRVRWSSKTVQDESAKGSDVIGFRFCGNVDEHSADDELIVFESKAQFTKHKANRLQDAINDSAKDHTRIAESLNFIKQKLFDKNRIKEAKQVERFQNPVDSPYKEIYGAAAVLSSEYFNSNTLSRADSGKIPVSSKSGVFIPHPHRDKLVLVVIKGDHMMDLVHELYKRAADEA